ncbi:MAG: hypothetical protein FD174_2535 [Geobacteraceae bacterium]|nr:MAG: hypothetical protein FD174_2535 [Geobacteraceae bacterium]
MFNNIIYVLGMPRSGTSWLGQVFDSSPQTRFRLSPLFSYAFKNQLNEHSTLNEWEELFKRVYHTNDEFMEQTARRESGLYPTFSVKDENPEFLVIKDTRFHNLTSQMLKLVDNLKIVVIVRNPCGAIYSWLNAPREFPQGADPLIEWRTGACRKNGFGEFWGFDDWKEVTNMYLKFAREIPERVLIVRYENLVDDSIQQIRRIFSYCGLDYTPQTEEFLKLSQKIHVDNEYAVFKNPKVKDMWKTGLQDVIKSAIINELNGSELEVFLK